MRIFALSAVEAGMDLIRAMLARGVRLEGVIALSHNGDRSSVAGYRDPGEMGRRLNLPIHYVDDYRLRSETDRARLAGLDIDILVVAGWQRLVPEWLIGHCSKAVIGLHGSARGISEGRGRSPQNWALICGAPEFEIAVFQIDPGVDSGPVLASRSFPYTAHDDILSSYQKSMLLSAEMIADIVSDWDAALAAKTDQSDGSATYLPQRTADDGAIDWSLGADMIRRHIAAVTRPYPGAFSPLGGGRVTIWRARPIGDLPLRDRGVPGQVIHVAEGGGFIIRAGDGYMMVDDYEEDEAARPMFKPGAVFGSVPFGETITAIIERHRARYPDQPLSQDILSLNECEIR